IFFQDDQSLLHQAAPKMFEQQTQQLVFCFSPAADQAGQVITFGRVSFELKDELKVKRVSGKVSLDKPLQEKPHGFQLTSDYTRCTCRI
ncbi:MAG: hypothetical protein ACOYYU_19535, partial [Chloroflexota bacterium]